MCDCVIDLLKADAKKKGKTFLNGDDDDGKRKQANLISLCLDRRRAALMMKP